MASHNRLDLTGKKFGELIALYRNDNKSTRISWWVCRCCLCGSEKSYRIQNLTSGGTKSCGCVKKKYDGSWAKPITYEYGFAALLKLYRRYKSNAKIRGKEFNISIEYFKYLTSQQCYFCGKNPEQISGNSPSDECNGIYFYNGLDRLDNNLGYIETNIVACCKYCNYAKRDLSEKDFLNIVERIYLCRIKQK